MVRHSGDHVGFAFRLYLAFDQAGVSGLNIHYFEIEDRGGVVKRWPIRGCQHQADAAAIKEGQTASNEKQLESENVAVEFDGAVGVVYVNGNLADLRNGDSAGGGAK